MKLDYGLDDLSEHTVLKLQDVLADQVAYELGPFMGDATVDLVAARLEMTTNEANRRFIHAEHPETSGAALRKNILRKGNRVPAINWA